MSVAKIVMEARHVLPAPDHVLHGVCMAGAWEHVQSCVHHVLSHAPGNALIR